MADISRVPLLVGFAEPPAPAQTVRMRYDTALRMNVLVAGGREVVAALGTLITETRESTDNSEADQADGAVWSLGTVVTATSENKDESEIDDATLNVAGALGTTLTKTSEGHDQTEWVAHTLDLGTTLTRTSESSDQSERAFDLGDLGARGPGG